MKRGKPCISLGNKALHMIIKANIQYLLLVEADAAVAFPISSQQTPQGFLLSELDQSHVDYVRVIRYISLIWDNSVCAHACCP